MSKAKENVFVAVIAIVVVLGGIKVRLEDVRYAKGAFSKKPVTEQVACLKDSSYGDVRCRLVAGELQVFVAGELRYFEKIDLDSLSVEVKGDCLVVRSEATSFTRSFDDLLVQKVSPSTVAGAWPFSQSVPVFGAVK